MQKPITMLLFLLTPLSMLVALAAAVTNTTSLRGASRILLEYYFSTTTATELGRPNPRAVLDNPLKGLLTSPRYTNFSTPDTPIPSTLDFYYIGLSEYVRPI